MQGGAWLWLVGCTPPLPDPVTQAVVVRAPAPAPAWLVGPVTFDAPTAGLGRKQHALCHGTDGAREALLVALDAGRGDAVSPVLDLACADPGWTRWVRERLAEDDPLGRRAALWWALVRDADPAVGAAMIADAPALPTLAWLREHARDVPERAVPMLGRLLREDPEAALDGVRWLANLDLPAAERALVTLHEHAPAELRDEVAAHLYGRTSEEARAIHGAFCGRTDDTRCGWGRPDPVEMLEGCLEGGVWCADADVARLVEEASAYRGAVADLLARCVADGGEDQRICARLLAASDPARALEALPADEEALADLRADLTRAPEARAAALVALGFAGVPADAPDVLAGLAAAGWAVPIAPERLDRQLYILADAVAATGGEGAAGLAFDGAQRSWSAPVVAGRTPHDAVFAYADGWRTRALLDLLRPDAATAAGLLNAVLAERGADRRVAVDVDARSFVIGPPDGLRALVREGLVRFLPPAPPPDPEDVPALPLPEDPLEEGLGFE